MVFGRAVISSHRIPVGCRASKAAYFTPDQIAARRAHIAQGQHVAIVESMLDGEVPLLHQRQTQVPREGESQLRVEYPIPATHVFCDIQRTAIHKVRCQAETGVKVESSACSYYRPPSIGRAVSEAQAGRQVRVS